MKTIILIIALFSLNSFAMSEEDQFILETQEELNLPDEAIPLMQAELQTTDPYMKARTLFCSEVGGAVVVDMAGLNCRSFKGDRISIGLIGLGMSVSLHAGVGILHAKRGSRNLKEGTYNVSFGAVHVGLGLMGLAITNDNKSINYRFKGLTIGAGFNGSSGRLVINKLN